MELMIVDSGQINPGMPLSTLYWQWERQTPAWTPFRPCGCTELYFFLVGFDCGGVGESFKPVHFAAEHCTNNSILAAAWLVK